MKRPETTYLEMQKRRRLAVARVQAGMSVAEVAKAFDVTQRSVQRWLRQYATAGERGLLAKPHPGRPCKLTLAQEKTVLGWLSQPASQFGFATELWTGKRVARLIRERLGVAFNDTYVCHWLTRHGFSSQKPARQPRERDEAKIQAWVDQDWPRLVKKGRPRTPTSPFSMRPASS